MFLIVKHQAPNERLKDVTYVHILVDYQPQKVDPHWTRLTVGGSRINYTGDVITPAAEINTSKLIINITISTPGER